MRIRALAAALAVALPAASAQAASPWYVSVDGGGYFRETSTGPFTLCGCLGNTAIGPVPGRRSLTFSPGWAVHLAAGRHLTSRLRLEAELGAAEYSSSRFTAAPNDASLSATAGGFSFPTTGTGASYHRITEGLNLFYDLPKVAFGVTPYVGLGGGIWEGRSNQSVYATAGEGGHQVTSVLGGNSTVGGYGMVEGGLAFKLSPHWSIVPSYRYQRSSGAGYVPSTNVKDRGDEAAHIAKVGLRYGF